MNKSVKGFTLIELLVVIAIIGLLASIVLVSLNSARNKGRDARIISDVHQIRAAIESGFNGYGYPDLGYSAANCNAAASITSNLATNVAANGCVNTSGPSNSVIQQLVADANSQGGANSIFFLTGAPTFGTNVTNFAIRGRLESNANAFFCIDSTGKSNQNDNNAVSGPNCH